MKSDLIASGTLLLTSSFVLAVALAVATPAAANQGDCSQPTTTGENPTASDCLTILRVAVGSSDCTPECICAPKGALPTTASDALLCLKNAVGQSVVLNCPCGADTTTTIENTTTTFVDPTTSVPNSSSTTTLTVTTTTTTPPTTLLNCDVRFRLASTEAVGGLSFDINYQLIFGLFVGDGAAVQCTALADAQFNFSNDQANKILSIGMLSDTGLAGPVELAECVYATNDPQLGPEDFRIRNVDATSPTAEPLDAEIEISAVACEQ